MHTEPFPSPESGRSGHKALIVALLLAAIVQVIIAVRSPTLSKDGIVFINMAKGLTRTPVETIRVTDQHPGYPAMILVGRKIAAMFPGTEGHRQWVIGAQLFSGLGGLLSVLLVWMLTRRLFDARIAAVAAILFAALPDFRRNAADAFADMPHLALYLAAAWTAVEGFSSKNPRWFIASGIASGLAYWIRPEGIISALVIGGVLGILAIIHTGAKRRFALAGLAAVVICAGVLAAPYPLIKGKLTAKKDITRLMERKTWSPAAETKSPVSQPDQAAEQPRNRTSPVPGFARSLCDLASELFGAFFKAIRYFLALPLLIGLIYCHKRREATVPGRLIGLLIACHTALLIALYVIARYISARHAMPIAALAMPWIALGWILSVEWLCRFAKRVRPVHALNAFLILFVILMLRPGVQPIHTQRLAVIHAAEWVRGHSTENEKLLSNSLYAAFHTDREPTLIGSHPNIPKESTLDALKTHRILIFDTQEYDFKEAWLPHVEETHDLVTLPETPRSRKPVLVYVARKTPPTDPVE